jgi:hypothetical protein
VALLKKENNLMLKSLEEQVNDFIQNPETRVFLYHNNDTGIWYWSIAVYEEGLSVWNTFWLNSFRTKKEAKKFVKDYGLRYQPLPN